MNQFEQTGSRNEYDLIIIGAGPAGMSAAATAASRGLSVALFDEQPAPGGQIYRSIGLPALVDERILGKDYYYGTELLREFEQARVDHYGSATVWEITKDRILSVSIDGKSRVFQGKRILLATGAQERPAPFPGWTLPGVMTCGSAQILLKSSGLTPATPLVLAGSGPLLLLIACQLQRAGVAIEAILDTTPTANYPKVFKHLAGALRGWRYLVKGMGLMAQLKRAGIPIHSGVSRLRAEADPGTEGCLSRVEFDRGGHRRSLTCQTLLVHQGVVPNVQLARSIGAEHRWNEAQLCWHPVVDSWGESSRPGLFIAGDTVAIGGALAAEQAGRLSALQICSQLRTLNAEQRDREAVALRKALSQQLAIRPFLDALYKPAEEFLRPSDETIVCRCEEVTAGQIRGFAARGCTGPNQAKAFGRAGMGPCQGRLCGLTVSQLIAEERGEPVSEVGYYNIRSPIKPLTLGELASMADQPEETVINQTIQPSQPRSEDVRSPL